jgi:type IV secretion system protein VirB10
MTNSIENVEVLGRETEQINPSLKSSIDQTYIPKKRWGLALFMLCIPLIFGGILYYAYSSYQEHKETVKAEKKSQKTIAESKAIPLGVESEPVRIKPAEIVQIQATPMPIEVVPNHANQQPQAPVTNIAVTPKMSRYDAPIIMTQPSVSVIASNQDSTAAHPLNINDERDTPSSRPTPSNPNNTNGMRLTPTSTPKARAGLLGNRNYVLAKGNEIDCGLNTAIISTLPGMVTCTVPVNVYSDNGKVVLIERGTLITGEYTGLKQGETRLSVLWDRIRTPEGVVIDLNSLGTDQLGRVGFDGDIDKHWGERVGAAFLMSTFKDLVAYKSAKDSNANTSTQSYQNTQTTGNDLASQILKQTINIAPTLVKNQGERIAIVVARDLDFADVYHLEVNESERP